MRKVMFVFCGSLLLSACSSSPPTNPGPVDQQVTLAPGQQQSIGGSRTTIGFVGVTSDSRCPAAAICVTSGDATARFQLMRGAEAFADLDLHVNSTKTRTIAGLTIELLHLSPYPITWNDIEPSAYRATVRVTR